MKLESKSFIDLTKFLQKYEGYIAHGCEGYRLLYNFYKEVFDGREPFKSTNFIYKCNHCGYTEIYSQNISLSCEECYVGRLKVD